MAAPGARPSGSAPSSSARCRSTSTIRETSDEGRPITVSDPESPNAQVFRRMAARIWEKVAGPDAERRAPPRIVIE